MGSVTAAIGLIVISATAGMAQCRAEVVEIRGSGGVARFTVEVADDRAEQTQGLMNRERMASAAGMLFIYKAPQRATFWMKNTLIPLDLIFVDARGVVTAVHRNARPLDQSLIDGGTGVSMVLEINGGLSAPLGIGPGSVMRHPAIEQTGAAWPCAG